MWEVLDGKGVVSRPHLVHNQDSKPPGSNSMVAVAALRGQPSRNRRNQMLQAILIGLLVGVILGAFLILRWPEGV